MLPKGCADLSYRSLSTRAPWRPFSQRLAALTSPRGAGRALPTTTVYEEKTSSNECDTDKNASRATCSQAGETSLLSGDVVDQLLDRAGHRHHLSCNVINNMCCCPTQKAYILRNSIMPSGALPRHVRGALATAARPAPPGPWPEMTIEVLSTSERKPAYMYNCLQSELRVPLAASIAPPASNPHATRIPRIGLHCSWRKPCLHLRNAV